MGHNLVKRGYENLEKTLFNLGARKMNEWNV
jgi:UDP-N-acetylglucosamine enolpyruvyl transferase